MDFAVPLWRCCWPLLGWVADTFSPRWALGVGALSGLAALGVGLLYLVRYQQLQVWLDGGRLHWQVGEARG